MDDNSKKEMNDYYSGRLREYGVSIEALVYKNREQMIKRYAMLTAIEQIPRNSSVLDVGGG